MIKEKDEDYYLMKCIKSGIGLLPTNLNISYKTWYCLHAMALTAGNLFDDEDSRERERLYTMIKNNWMKDRYPTPISKDNMKDIEKFSSINTQWQHFSNYEKPIWISTNEFLPSRTGDYLVKVECNSEFMFLKYKAVCMFEIDTETRKGVWRIDKLNSGSQLHDNSNNEIRVSAWCPLNLSDD